MPIMGNRVQSFSYEVGSVVIRWYIGEGKGLADVMFRYEMVSNVNVLSLRIVDRILRNVDTRGIIYHNWYGDGINELYECVQVPD